MPSLRHIDVLAFIIVIPLATNNVLELNVLGFLIPLGQVGEQLSALLASVIEGLHFGIDILVEVDDVGIKFQHFVIKLSKGGPDEGDSCTRVDISSADDDLEKERV